MKSDVLFIEYILGMNVLLTLKSELVHVVGIKSQKC